MERVDEFVDEGLIEEEDRENFILEKSNELEDLQMYVYKHNRMKEFVLNDILLFYYIVEDDMVKTEELNASLESWFPKMMGMNSQDFYDQFIKTKAFLIRDFHVYQFFFEIVDLFNLFHKDQMMEKGVIDFLTKTFKNEDTKKLFMLSEEVGIRLEEEMYNRKNKNTF